MNLNFQHNINDDFLLNAEEEAFQIILRQKLDFNRRWNERHRPLLRKLGIAICIFGISIATAGIVLLIIEGNIAFYRGSTYFSLIAYDVFFLILYLFLHFFDPNKTLSKLENKIAIKVSKSNAKRLINPAKKLIPFDAEYIINDDLISYYRIKENIRKLAWTRKLKGVAIHGFYTTLFFTKWTSFTPKLIILHKDFDILKTTLEQKNIEIKTLEP